MNTASTPQPRELRVSDAEREHVVALLQKAIGRGLLDLDQFTERADIAYSSSSRGQLNVALADLPGLVHVDAPRPGSRQQQGTPRTQRPVSDAVELVGHFSNITRKGRWSVPERMRISAKSGNVRLDFTEADFPTTEVWVALEVKWGNVEFVVPHGAAVDVNAVNEIKFGSLDDRTNTAGSAGNPRIIVSGRVHGGTLRVRHPRRGLFG